MNWKRLLSSLHSRFASSRITTLLAVKVRNQCNLVIAKRFGLQNMSPYLNGEYLLLEYLIPFCKTYFDVGANKGEWTNHLILNGNKQNSRFYLYEPGHSAFLISRDRFAKDDHVQVFNAALSDKTENILFYEKDNASELSSAIEGWGEIWGGGPGSTIEVNTLTIDSEMEKLGLNYLDFLKIDTEGFDLRVLKGAEASIRENKIGFIQFEYNSAWAMIGATLKEAYKLLESNGYRVFLLKPAGLYDYNLKKFGEFYVFSNFLAVLPGNQKHIEKLIKGEA